MLFTVVVVLSEKVETTVQKGIFRAVGTVVGGAIGYAAMLRTQSATNPVVLVAVLCLWVFVGSWLALKTEVMSTRPCFLSLCAFLTGMRLIISKSGKTACRFSATDTQRMQNDCGGTS